MMNFCKMYCIIPIVSLIFGGFFTNAINFDITNVVNIKVNYDDRVEGSYFGYSLLLQKGSLPLVIVGAPKFSKRTGGRIFACDILRNDGCVKYHIKAGGNKYTFNGNLFGSSLDGDDEFGKSFIACAPRKAVPVGAGQFLNYILKGSCILHRNSSVTRGGFSELKLLTNEDPENSISNTKYLDSDYGQAGFDLFYNGETSSVLLGAPGKINWNGAIINQSLDSNSDYRIISQKHSPYTYDYLGYKVGRGRNTNSIFLFAGAPRAGKLFGKVKLFNDKNENYRTFHGNERGAYFGSVVLAYDVNNDGADDFFIGAPTAAGSSFEEGCVYFYNNANGTPIKLVGIGRGRARFGTNIVALGDIDLDSFNDIAIAAPLEDDGRGAVYVFMGSSDGIQSGFGQRLVPSTFANPALNVKGFGIGISRGNDIDGNGHNDLAIGAYKSGHVFVIRTKPVIDFETTIELYLIPIGSQKYIILRYCINFKPRSKTSNIQSLEFMFNIIQDYRVQVNRSFPINKTVFPRDIVCEDVDFVVMSHYTDIQFLTFKLYTQTTDKVFAEGPNTIEKSIPYSKVCERDQICQTKIVFNVFLEPDDEVEREIVLGLNKSVSVNVVADNIGEAGYGCNIHIKIPKELKLSDKRQCSFKNLLHVICPFDPIPSNSTVNKKIHFDVTKIDPTALDIRLFFKLKCLGENINYKDTMEFNINLQNNPYIQGKSHPEVYKYNARNAQEDDDVMLHHIFTLGNFGPSPVKTDVYLLVPQLVINETDLIQLVEAKGTLEGTQTSCYPRNLPDGDDDNIIDNVILEHNLYDNSTAAMNCSDRNKCLTLFCEGDYLYSPTATAKYSLRVKINTTLLVNHLFHITHIIKNIIAVNQDGN
ncbi:integrin alpha-PS3-like isoform X2 [Diabrotica undecimpunctata]|uniref:integrin alpha-PS3-like isoform X2 n=1 Tax=Diabrotica undecimpunctata TaxID=50387 RepID=UPI003B63D66A